MGDLFSSNVGYNSVSAAATSNLNRILNATDTKNERDVFGAYADAIPDDELDARWRDPHGKTFSILQSASGITSVISSSVMIWMILRSHERLSTTQHRLLLGLCISNIIFSSSLSTFSAYAPSENAYMTWNARGNQATCTAQGFLATFGVISGLFYNVSLNLYFLAVASDEFIRAKIERFLHGVPIVVALSWSTYQLVNKHYNDDEGRYCIQSVNDVPHCLGYDIGETREGFEIPCWRGFDEESTSRILPFTIEIVLLGAIPLLIMIVSPAVICMTARDQDSKQSQSRSVKQKALGYAFAWILPLGIRIISLATGTPVKLYLQAIFLPLQGLFNLMIFLLLKIMAAKKSKKRGETVSWCKAFFTAFWSKGNGGENRATSSSRLRKSRNEDAASDDVNVQTPMSGGMKKKTTKKRNAAHEHQEEEEKCEIQAPDHLNPNMTREIYSAACPAIYERNIVPSSSTETSTAPAVNLSTSTAHMVGMKKVDLDENVTVGNALSDIVEDPCEDPMAVQDEEEGLNECEKENKEIMPMTAAADMDEQKEISMENQEKK